MDCYSRLAQPAKAIVSMRPRIANVALRMVLAGIIVATSLCGSSLHTLFGIEHPGFAGGLIIPRVDRHEDSGPAFSAGRELTEHDGRCIVCNYLAQVQLPESSFAGGPTIESVPMPPLEFSPALPSSCLLAFHSRGPPAA